MPIPELLVDLIDCLGGYEALAPRVCGLLGFPKTQLSKKNAQDSTPKASHTRSKPRRTEGEDGGLGGSFGNICRRGPGLRSAR